jgi:hypothetical protein
MVLLLSGAALLARGLFAGTVLVAAPLGLAGGTAGLALWVLFPLFCAAGYALCVVGARAHRLALLSFAVSCLLLVLGLAAAAALVLAGASLLPTAGSTVSLWYVLVVAGLLGSIGAAARSAAAHDTTAR